MKSKSKLLNFAQFVQSVPIEIIYSPRVEKAYTDGVRRIYISSSLKSKPERFFVILHELAHIYLTYLNRNVKSMQPVAQKENESICDILAALYLRKVAGFSSKKIIQSMLLLTPTYTNKYRVEIVRNVLNKFKDVEDITKYL
ncbi:MAG: ImmA/IrrE family metallo-endopeptidase [Candidatus Calescibacterium sp.]|jgi:Zn-dependent peptidase ImmA (M78 family)